MTLNTVLSGIVPLQGGGSNFGVLLLVYLAVVVVMIAGVAKAFQKANQPWWAAIVPIYNVYIMLKIAGRPGWWLLLFFVPLVNFVVALIITNDISKAFGHGIGYTLGLIFLGFVFWPLLGFGDSTYQGVPN